MIAAFRRRIMASEQDRDSGYSLMEVMVASTIFLFLTTAVLTVALSTGRAVTLSKQLTDQNAEARVAMERLSRELRQAKEIQAVTLPATPNGPLSIRFGVDFSAPGTAGAGIIETNSIDPEILTYSYDPAAERLTLTANDIYGTAVTRPLLAAHVTRFNLQFRSSLWQYDANGDGITDWTEIDANTAAGGNNNGVLDVELTKIDSVVITLTVLKGKYAQTYTTQVGLRNQELS